MDRLIPFPQADDFEKIKVILNTNENSLNDKEKLSSLLGDISERQISYYLSAAMYLGIIYKENGNKYFTNIAKNLKLLPDLKQNIELVSMVLSNKPFSYAFTLYSLYGDIDEDDVKKFLEIELPGYSNDVYIRRAQTVISWTKWAYSFIKTNSIID